MYFTCNTRIDHEPSLYLSDNDIPNQLDKQTYLNKSLVFNINNTHGGLTLEGLHMPTVHTRVLIQRRLGSFSVEDAAKVRNTFKFSGAASCKYCHT